MIHKRGITDFDSSASSLIKISHIKAGI